MTNDFYEMELIGAKFMLIAVPVGTPEELKKRLLGAIMSYHMSLASVDYTVKRYGDPWRFRDPSPGY